MRRVDEGGEWALDQTEEPVNKLPDMVTYIVRSLKLMCPMLGKARIAQLLARTGLHLKVTTIGRMRKRDLSKDDPIAERAAFLKYMDHEGNALQPFLITEDNVKDFELEIAWLFPAFFDHPTEYLGRRELDGVEVHVLRVALPLGAPLEYYLDGQTFLPVRAEGSTVHEGKKYTLGRLYHDYAEVDGVFYPTRMELLAKASEPEPAIIESLEFDVKFAPEHFAIPDSL